MDEKDLDQELRNLAKLTTRRAPDTEAHAREKVRALEMAIAELPPLDNSITDLHSAADEGNQKETESSLKEVEAAFGQLKSLDPDNAFKSAVH